MASPYPLNVGMEHRIPAKSVMTVTEFRGTVAPLNAGQKSWFAVMGLLIQVNVVIHREGRATVVQKTRFAALIARVVVLRPEVVATV